MRKSTIFLFILLTCSCTTEAGYRQYVIAKTEPSPVKISKGDGPT